MRELFLDVRTWDVEAMVEEAISVGLFCTISVKVKSPNYFLPMIKELDADERDQKIVALLTLSEMSSRVWESSHFYYIPVKDQDV